MPAKCGQANGEKSVGTLKKGRKDSEHLGDKQGFGVLFGDGEELEGGLAGAAGTLLPTADGVGADIQIGGEEGLAGLERAPDVANFFGGKRFGAAQGLDNQRGC